MWGKVGFWGCVGILCLGYVPTIFADETPPSVVINELAWAGSSASSQDEWIELKNTTQEEINLSGWQIQVDNPGTDYTITIPSESSSLIKSRGFFLIAKFKADNIKSALNVEADLNLEGIGFGITNSSFIITLWNDAGDKTDEAWDGSTPEIGYRHSASGSASIERCDVLADGRLPANWQQSIDSVNFDDLGSDIINYGTPGAENSVITEPPTIESISPNSAETDSQLQIESITGTNFGENPIVQLKLNGQVITANDINVASSTLIDSGQFDLDSAELGKWDLVITNPDGQTATLPQAVEITEPPPQYDLTTTVRINEIYPQPNTTSNDEFIELYNFGDKVINLTGWQLDDIRGGGSNPHTFSGIIINSKSFVTIYKPASKLTLNDNGDSVYLLQPNGFVLDQTSYENASKGKTLSRFPEGWKWTETPTPNGINVFTETPPPEEPDQTYEPDDTPKETPQKQTSPKYKPNSILITEILPNPNEGDEFIELFNNTEKPIDLKDWKLQDASGKTYAIDDFDVTIQSANTSIEPQQYVFITQTTSHISLNNSGGDELWLLDPGGTVIDAVSYPDKAPTGVAYALDAEEEYWTWTSTPTPGKTNIIAAGEETEMVEPSPEPTLASSGLPLHKWLGIILVSFTLTAMLFWYEEEKYACKNSSRYHRFIKNLHAG